MKQVICRSGIRGWQAKLQSIYKDYEEFAAYDCHYNISGRLGYSSAVTAWRLNPVICGSVNPSDLRKVA
jgi:hypothetical protein